MRFKIIFGAVGIICIINACNSKCKEKQDLIVGKWTNNIGYYYFNKDLSYSYKFLGSNNSSDTISVADSAIGTYKIDQCQKVISLTQIGYFPKGNTGTFVPKNITYGTWKFVLPNDSLLEIETSTTYLKLTKLQDF